MIETDGEEYYGASQYLLMRGHRDVSQGDMTRFNAFIRRACKRWRRGWCYVNHRHCYPESILHEAYSEFADTMKARGEKQEALQW